MRLLKLPLIWINIILRSTCGILDGRKFTAHLQISAGCISFYKTCTDCGKMYNSIIHAFTECPRLETLTSFVFGSMKGLINTKSNYLLAIILFGLSARRNSPPKTKALCYGLRNSKAYIAKNSLCVSRSE
uniref:Reverse transcriptase n=1 Tax=Lepeophtheirus salmonis TaxID=72036 RepID=A0A0K2TNF4_LEPSM